MIEPNSMVNPSLAWQAVAPLVWKHKVSPFKIMRTMGRRFSRKELHIFVKNEMNTNGDTDLEKILVDYLQCIFLMRGTSEVALFVLFDQGLFAHKPLNLPTRLASSNFPLPISFIFGKHDWVSGEGCQDVLLSNKYRATG